MARQRCARRYGVAPGARSSRPATTAPPGRTQAGHKKRRPDPGGMGCRRLPPARHHDQQRAARPGPGPGLSHYRCHHPASQGRVRSGRRTGAGRFIHLGCVVHGQPRERRSSPAAAAYGVCGHPPCGPLRQRGYQSRSAAGRPGRMAPGRAARHRHPAAHRGGNANSVAYPTLRTF
jgi:hypothetical protein